MQNKILKIVSIVVAILAILFVAAVAYNYVRLQRGDLVKWDGKFYTKEEFSKMFPPQYCDAEAKNNPEDVYKVFRQALLDNDIETALNQINIKSRDKYREAFKDQAKFDSWVKRLPEKIEKENEHENFANYDLDMGSQYKNTVNFIKNCSGYWKIDSI